MMQIKNICDASRRKALFLKFSDRQSLPSENFKKTTIKVALLLRSYRLARRELRSIAMTRIFKKLFLSLKNTLS
jgi:hypothetical protein